MTVKISQLTASSLITSDDFFPIVDSGSLTTLRASAQQVLNYVTASTFDTLNVTNLTSSNITGSTAKFNSISGSTANISGDLVVGGKLTAHEYHTEIVSASIIYDSGSTKFGNDSGDTHEFSGSILLSGTLNANNTISGTTAQFTSITSSDLVITGGYVLMHEPLDLGERIGDNAYVLYNSVIDKLAAFPGLYVTGAITASTALSASNVAATTAVFSVVSASVVSASSYIGPIGGGGGTPGGTDTTIQFNSGSTFSGSSQFVWDYVSGNLGVGTNTPVVKLDMTGEPVMDGDNRVILQVCDTTAMAAGVGAGLTFGGIHTSSGGFAGFAGIKGIKENSTDGNLDSALVLMTRKDGVGSIAEKMRITSDGYVGIGTSNPSERLHVSNTGSVYTLIENTTNSGYSSVQVKNDIGSYIQLISVGTATAGTWFGGDTSSLNRANTVGFRTGGSESALLFAAQANVPLHIGQNDTTRLLFGTSEASFNNNKSNYDFRVAGDNDDNAIFVKASSDRVGIGTQNPASKMHVREAGSSIGAWKGRIVAGGDNVAFLMGEYDSKAWLGAHNAALNSWEDFYINPDGAYSVFIGSGSVSGPLVSAVNSTGRVGIAKTSPNSTLDVNGDVTITGSLTTTNTNSSIAFSASNASYWTGSPPATLQEALNRIAEAIFNGITGSIA
jgi:hypothetical protein